MHPNTYLTSLWRTEVIDQVFVAMSFEERFRARFETVVRPAIEAESFDGISLRAYRVDNSKTGDSILTDIVDGIAHSRLVLADVSVIDEGRDTGIAVRNGNVMYEVGVALACRTPSEVLLVRDDSKRFLFDVSTIPHLTLDFSDIHAAMSALRGCLADRLREADLVRDARVRVAGRAVTADELRILRMLSKLEANQASDLTMKGLGMLSNPDQRGLDGLVAKGCIRSVAENGETDGMFFALTPFGYALARLLETQLRRVSPITPNDATSDNQAGA